MRVEDIAGIADTAPFLDVCLSGEKDWVDAVGRHSMFRIPSFKDKYYGLRDAVVTNPESETETDDEFDGIFLKAAHDIAVALFTQAKRKKWSEVSYGRGQVNLALHGALMRLDKAVIAVLAINRVAERFGLGESWSIRRHEVAACIFYFANLFGRLRSIALAREDGVDQLGGSEEERKARDKALVESLLEELADATGQSVPVLRNLAGRMPDDDSIGAHQAAATHLACFPTLYAVLGFIVRNQPAGAKKPKARDTIVRRRAHARKMEALPEEVVKIAARVTHGPYKWEPAPKDARDHWPPKFCTDQEASPPA